MKKFEYYTDIIHIVDLDKVLRKRGKECWELVTVLRVGDSTTIRLIFKREKLSIDKIMRG